MAKWTCRCGQHMNDHSSPDDNYYRVYSDREWHLIEHDDSGNMNYYEDIPLQTFDVYRCPTCGRLVIFGDGNFLESYIRED